MRSYFKLSTSRALGFLQSNIPSDSCSFCGFFLGFQPPSASLLLDCGFYEQVNM